MPRYVQVVKGEGVNVILWDGVTPIRYEGVMVLESSFNGRMRVETPVTTDQDKILALEARIAKLEGKPVMDPRTAVDIINSASMKG